MKQQMEEVRNSLQELCQVIIEKIKKEEKQSLFPFLQECQQLAVAWGESIENIEGTGTESHTLNILSHVWTLASSF